MKRSNILGASLAALFLIGPPGAIPAAEKKVNIPMLAPWTGPYGGVPPFDKVEVAQFKPALEAAMAEQLAELEKITDDPAPPTFANTLAAFEKTGRTLDRLGPTCTE